MHEELETGEIKHVVWRGRDEACCLWMQSGVNKRSQSCAPLRISAITRSAAHSCSSRPGSSRSLCVSLSLSVSQVFVSLSSPFSVSLFLSLHLLQLCPNSVSLSVSCLSASLSRCPSVSLSLCRCPFALSISLCLGLYVSPFLWLEVPGTVLPLKCL